MRRYNLKCAIIAHVLFLALLLRGTGNAQGAEATARHGLSDAEIQSILRDNVELDKESVGLVVGIVDAKGSRVIGYGKLDNGTDAKVDGDTIFRIGSITKVFTALLLQDMVERGEMKLDDPVQEYLPASVKVPTFQGKPITLLHLATHTSGLPRDSKGELFSYLSRCKLDRAPGTREEYSNFGMALLGHVIELKAGKDYGSLVTERICEPLGMASTHVIVPPDLRARLATGHAMPGYRVKVAGINPYPGAGGLYSTANDLLKFVAAYSGLESSSLHSLMENAEATHNLESGKRRLVWFGGGSVFEHGGLVSGFKAEIAFDVQRRRGVVLLSNCENNSSIIDALWRPLLEDRSLKPTNWVAADTAIYERYVGQYRTGEGEVLTVRHVGERMLLQWIGMPGLRLRVPSFEVFPSSETEFRSEFYGNQIVFVPEAKTGQCRMTFTNADLGFHAELKRVSTNVPSPLAPIHPDPRLYDDYAGKYRKTLLFGLIRLEPILSISHQTDENGDHLYASVSNRSGFAEAGEIFPRSDTEFIPGPEVGDDIRLKFVRNKSGKANRVVVNWNGVKHSASRISDVP